VINARLNRALLKQVQLQSAVRVHAASPHTGGFASPVLFIFHIYPLLSAGKADKSRLCLHNER
jgi:hypothetical protein